MRIGFDLGAKKLVEYQRRFGFGAENRYRIYQVKQEDLYMIVIWVHQV